MRPSINAALAFLALRNLQASRAMGVSARIAIWIQRIVSDSNGWILAIAIEGNPYQMIMANPTSAMLPSTHGLKIRRASSLLVCPSELRRASPQSLQPERGERSPRGDSELDPPACC